MMVAGLVLAVLAALGATVLAAVHASPAAVGWTGALAFAGMAIAAGGAARSLNAPSDLTEPRHPHGPSHPEPLPADAVSRGVFNRWWGAALAAFAVLGAVPFVALARRPAPPISPWTRGVRLSTADGRLLKADDLSTGSVETVFPAGALDVPESATMLLRLPDGVETIEPGREEWTPSGNLAYSKICTHAGCPVAIYRQASFELYCPCHQSVFDVLHGARPVSGPATRALPQLPLAVDGEGYLIAGGGFSAPVGPDEWWRPA